MKAKLTAKFLAGSQPKAKEYEVRDTEQPSLILRVHPSGRKVYYCQYSRGKKVTIGRADALTPAEARYKAREILADAHKGIDPMEKKRERQTEAKREREAHTLESFIAEVYAPYLLGDPEHKHPKTTISFLTSNFLPTLGKKKLSEITQWDIEAWKRKRSKEGIKPAAINRYRGVLRAALNHAIAKGLISENPVKATRPAKVDNGGRRVRYLSENEEGRLRTALDVREGEMRRERESANEWRAIRGYDLLPEFSGDHLKPMILVSLNTGVRRGELFNLKWTDIDLDRHMLTVRGEGTKSGQTRHVPLNDEAVSTLKAWRSGGSQNGLVFPGRDGKRFDNVNSSFRKLMRDAGITDFTWHDLRHTFASKLVMAGVELNTVRELLGHTSAEMTLRYAHLADKVKAAAVAKLGGSSPARAEIESLATVPMMGKR